MEETSRFQSDGIYYDTFPNGFLWGCSTSAYQVEGGWNVDGKGENTWDNFCHEKPERIDDKTNGDFACDSYHRYKDDVQLLKNMRANCYRFSLNWSRILPKGTLEVINQLGINYYNNLINELLKNGITPMVTINHFDIPQAFADKYPIGWLNEDLVTHFENFARFCYKTFGDRVKLWLTINEIFIHSMLAYEVGIHAPGVKNSFYLTGHNLLKAHAVSYRIYEEEFKSTQKGKVGLAIDTSWSEPADLNSESDQEAADRARQFRFGWITHTITHGCYPPVMREFIDRRSRDEGLSQSRLPTFSEEWAKKLKGSYDFIGLNHYSCDLVTSLGNKVENGQPLNLASVWQNDQENSKFFDNNTPTASVNWIKIAPRTFRKLLNWIKDEYENPEIIITENGCSEVGIYGPPGDLEDTQRVKFFHDYTNEMLKAIKLDGCNVTGYLCWCLLDGFEWSNGFDHVFGVHHVDRSDPKFKRTPKASARLLTRIFGDNGFLKE